MDLASTCNKRESDEAELTRNISICKLRNSETQRKLLSANISPSQALGLALIDDKGYFNHQKLTNMAKSTNGPSFNSFSAKNHGKKSQHRNK